jgi:hypothetical protein
MKKKATPFLAVLQKFGDHIRQGALPSPQGVFIRLN